MKRLFGILAVLALVSCKKDKTPLPVPTPAPTKWELIPGHYKVFDTLGNYIYEMDISYIKAYSANGYPSDSFKFDNFDNQFNLKAYQNQNCFYPNCVEIGSYEAIVDSIGNRWNIFGLGGQNLSVFRNDTIVFYFEKQNMPYWWNDGTSFFQGNLKHVAVKQH